MLKDSIARGLEASRILRERPWELELDKVDLATDTLELSVSLSTGEVIVLRCVTFKPASSVSNTEVSSSRLVYGERELSGYAASMDLESATEDADDAVAGALRDLSLDRIPDAPLLDSQNSHSSPNPSSKSSSSPHRRLSLGRRKSVVASSKSILSHEPEPELQDQHVDISRIIPARPSIDGFRPIAAFTMPPSRRTQLAMSDVGFLAASSEGALLIVDMRGPEVLLFETPAASDGGKGKGKVKTDPSAVTSLTWAICAIGEGESVSSKALKHILNNA